MDYLLKFLVPSSANVVIDYINSFSSQSKALGIGGILGLIFISYALFEASEGALNEIWHSFKERTRLNKIFVFTNLLFWGPFLLGTSFYLSTKIVSMPYIGIFSKIFLSLFPFFISLLAFSLFYFIIPMGKIDLKSAFSGGAISSFLCGIVKHGFEFYIKNAISFKAFTVLYGPLVILPIFLFWIYLLWVITLFGAEVAYYVQFGENGVLEKGYLPNFAISLSVLTIISKKFIEGKKSTSDKTLTREIRIKRGLIRKILFFLEKENIIISTNNGYLPTLPPERIELSAFFQLFIPDIVQDSSIKEIIENVKHTLKDITLKDILYHKEANSGNSIHNTERI